MRTILVSVFFRRVFPALAALVITTFGPRAYAADPLPTVTSADRLLIGPQQPVVISGTNFIGISSVKFGGVESVSFSATSDISIAAVAPNSGWTSGAITVTNSGGTATSSFTVTFTSPNIGSALANTTVSAGGRGALTVANKVWGTGTLFYQWKKDGIALTAVAGQISGVTSDTLVLTNVRAADAASAPGYSVSVTDSLGSASSTAATLRVSAPPLAWNPATDFAVTHGNPNGVWSYGSMDTGFVTFTPYVNTGGNSSGYASWYGSGGDQTPAVALNGQTTPFNGVPAGYVLLHPSSGHEPSVLRWTAPLAATVRVIGQFHAGDSGAMQVAVRHNNTVRFSATDAGVFDLTVTVVVGDRLDFAVFGGYLFGSTGLQLTLAAVTTALPLTTADSNKLSLGTFGGGTQVRIDVTGTGDLVDSRLLVHPDGSLAGPAGAPWLYANSGAAYAGVGGFPAGDGLNRYAGGGLNYDANSGNAWLFAGKQTTDTTDPATIRAGAVVGTFVSSPARSDWFAIGFGGTFTVPAGGATLYVAVNEAAVPSANADNHGAYSLSHISVVQANNLLASAVVLAGTSHAVSGSNVGASKEGSEPSHAGNAGGASVWWTWTAPKTGVVSVSTIGSNFDTLLAVYTGTAIGSLTTIASDDNSGPSNTSKLNFNAVAGTAYKIAVDGAGGATGNITLNLGYAYYFGTFAGLAGVSGSADGTGGAARVSLPNDVAVDSSGHVFVADYNNHTIRKITPGGVVTTLAGTAGSTGSTDGTGSAARFYFPVGVAVDGSGNVFVVEHFNHTVRKVTAGGVVTTLAGTALSIGDADGTGAAARFNYPLGVAVDATGNVYVADYLNHTIRKITAGGVVTTLAGTAGSAGSADGTGSAARFNVPRDVAVDGSGNLFVSDSDNQTIRRITAGGVVTTFSGAVGAAGSVDGGGGAARFSGLYGLVVDNNGNVFVAEGGNHTIRKITAAGVVTTLAGEAGSAGGTDGISHSARFNAPTGVALDGSGNFYVADYNNHTIRKGVPAYAPEVTSVSPTGFAAGAIVTITGANFTAATAVTFSGTAAVSFTVVSPSTITAVAPATLTAGNIAVTGPGGTSTVTTAYVVGAAGSTFAADVDGWSVTSFADLSADNYSLVGTYAATHLGSGGNPGGYISSNDPDGGDFLFSAPAAFLGNRSSSVGSTLTYDLIHQVGAVNYQTTDVILIGNGARLLWRRNPDLVPLAASWIPVSVPLSPTAEWRVGTTTGALATLADFQNVLGNLSGLHIHGEFTIGADTTGLDNVILGAAGPGLPAITSISSSAVVAGATVTLTGSGFTGATAVSFNGTPAASFTVVSALTITAVVPAAATSGNVTVTSPSGTSTTSVVFTVITPAPHANDRFDPGANGEVFATVVQPDGKIILSGNFSTLQPFGSAAAVSRPKLARLQRDGTVDFSFLATASLDAAATQISVQPDGKILLAGTFTTVNGVTRNRLARLHADGSLDTTFDPNANGTVSALARQPDGKILIGGLFTALQPNGAGSASTRSRLARLLADGSLDSAFNVPFDSGGDTRVDSLALQPDGAVLVGGRFSTIGDSGRVNLARFSSAGVLDAAFTPAVSGDINRLVVLLDGRILVAGAFNAIGGQSRDRIAILSATGAVENFNPGSSSSVNDVAVQADGRIVVAGAFTTIANGSRTGLARLLPDGSLDPAFVSVANNIVRTLALQPDGSLLVGGDFTTLGGHGRNRIARVLPDGSVERALVADTNGVIEVAVRQPDGKTIIGGAFTTVAGVARTNLARLNADSTLDTSFENSQPNGTVHALVVQPDGKILVGGAFSSLPNLDASRQGFVRLTATGGLDSSVNLQLNAEASVLALALQPDGKFILGGVFSQSGGNARNCLARFNADGTIDSIFNPGAQNSVTALALQANGSVLLGGAFANISGIPRAGLARVDTNGTLDATFDPGANEVPLAIVVQPDGKILLGGRFNAVAGATRIGIARLNSGGTIDAAFNPGTDGPANSLALGADGAITVGGNFNVLAGSVRANLGRIAGAGALDAAFEPLANGEVYTVLLQPDGKTVVAGNFTHVGGQARARLARLVSTAPTATTITVTTTAVTLVRSGPLPELAWVTFEKSSDGVTGWTSLGTATRIGTTANWQLTGQVLSSASVFYLRARGAAPTGVYGSSSLVEHVQQIFLALPLPTLASFSPAVLGTGVPVTIMGSNFTGATAVRFNGVNAANFTVDSPTQITAIVPSGVTTGAVTVVVPGGTGTSPTNYTTTTAPLIVSINPASGTVGRIVTILGGNFGAITNFSAPSVSFNGVATTAQRQAVPGGFRVAVPTGATTGAITVTVSGVPVVSSTFTVLTSGTAPANDDFANAQVMTGATGTTTGTTAFATKQSGEPTLAPSGTRSVWFSWVAPTSGAYIFDQAGSEFGAYLGVYTGSAVNALTLRATGDQPNTFTFNYSPAAFVATAGVTYFIVVDGFQGTSGDFKLTWAPLATPTVASFTPLSGYAGSSMTITGTNFTRGATVTIGGVSATAIPSSATTLVVAVLPSVTTAGPVVVTTVGGSSSSGTNFTVPAQPAGGGRALVNLSAIATVGTGANVLHGNFIIEGSSSKTVLLRAVGPKLGSFGITGFLVDPKLEVFNGQGQSVAQNDDWDGGTAIVNATAAVGAFALASGSKDAAVLVTLSPGAYTLRAEGVGGMTGQALVEIYDTETSLRIPYLALRQSVASGGTLVAGFVFSGAAQRLLVRAIGPALSAHGISGALANPTLNLLGGNQLIASNDNWGTAATNPALVSAAALAGLLPLADGSNDAAFLVDLVAGAYTIQVSGVSATTGIMQIEIAQIDASRAASFAPALIVPPQSTHIIVGGAASFAAPALGSPAPTYQWLRNDVLISGATNASLPFTNLQSTDAANYTVVMTNSAGTTTSAPFVLAPPLPIVASLSPTTVTAGGTVTLAGSHFIGATIVRFNGLAAAFTVVSDTSITATVPLGVSSGTITVITPSGTSVVTTNFTAIVTPVVQTLYVATGQGSSAQLYTVNPATAATTLVGSITMGGSALTVTGLAFHPLTGVLYGVTGNEVSSTVAKKLVTINPANGLATLVGTLMVGETAVTATDITFDANGKLYLWKSGGGPLGTVNLSTAAVITLGSSLNGTQGNGLAFTPDGLLYVAGPPTGNLGRVDPATGALTLVAALNGAPEDVTGINAMASNLSGLLYAVDKNSGKLLTINAATGAVTVVGTFPFTTGDAIAFAITPPPPAPLLHRYAFDSGAVTDLIGTDHGTLVNGATITAGRLVLDGTDDHVQFAAKIVPATGDFSVAFFAQQLSVQGGFREIISQGSSGGPGFYVGHDSSRVIRVGDNWISTGQAFPNDGLLHHYAVTGDATNTKLYIDGVLVQSKGSALSRSATGSNTKLGNQYDPHSEYFHGALDEVRIYGGALTASEVAALAASVPPTISTPPVAFSSGTVGGTVTLTVAASSGATYQWRKFGQPIAGATTTTLTLGAGNTLALFDAALYDVVVTNGSTSVPSSASRVTVAPAQNLPAALTASGAFTPLFEYDQGQVSRMQRGGDGKVYLAGVFTRFAAKPRPGFARLLADGALDESFVPVPAGGSIRAFAVQADGKVIIGGDFSTVGGYERRGLARLNASGTLDHTFNPVPIGAAGVFTVLVQADGRIVAAGNFGDASTNIVRLNTDGSNDASFNVGAGFSAAVNSMALQPDQKIVVGGNFSFFNGVPVGQIARLGANGALDPGFVISNGAAVGFNDHVNSVALQADGKILVGGDFSQYAGTPRDHLARLLPNGLLDIVDNGGSGFAAASGFNYDGAQVQALADGGVLVTANDQDGASAVFRLLATGAADPAFAASSGFQSDINAAIQLAGGQVLVALDSSGNFNTTPIGRFVRLSSTAVLDPTYTPALRSAGSVSTIAAAPGGQWIIGGGFGFVNGVARNNLARLNADGSLDLAFMNTGTGFTGPVSAVLVSADGRVVVAGEFGSFSGTDAGFIVRLDHTGVRDTGFLSGTGFNHAVRTLAFQADGKILVGGLFGTFQSVLCPALIRLDSTGTLDSTFNPGGTGPTFGAVFTLLVRPDGSLYAGGTFSAYNGAASQGLVRLTSAGSRDGDFAVGAAGFNNTVMSLALQPDGNLVVGGNFSTYQNNPTGKVARLLANGLRDPAFAATEFLDGFVQTVLLQSDGKIVAGGYFSGYGHTTTLNVASLARLNMNGTIDSTFRVAGLDAELRAAQFTANGGLLVGGGDLRFPDRRAAGLALLEAAPVPVIATQPTAPVNPAVGASVTLDVGATGLNLVYQWKKNGVAIADATGSSFNLASLGLNDAGNYTVTVKNLYGSATSTAASLTGTGTAPTITGQPATVSVPAGTTATLTVAATGATHYQWRRLGVPIAGATNSAFTLAGAVLGDAALYDVLVGNGLSVTRSAVGRVAVTNGNTVLSPLAVDRSFLGIFEAGENGHGQPSRILAQPDGTYYVAGNFTSVDGAIRFGLARFSAAGVIDPSFAPEISEGSIKAMARQFDGKLVLVGDFHRVNGVECNHIARLNPNGTVDPTFVSGGGTGTFDLLFAVAVQTDQKILIGGNFSTYGGETAGNHLARLNTNGTLDTAFRDALLGGLNNTVNDLAVHADGRIYAVGAFSQFNSTPANHLVVLNANGTRFALTGFPDNSFGGGTEVFALVLHPDGKMVLGGSFTSFSGTSVGRLVGLNSDGSLDTAFSTATGSSANGFVTRLLRQSDGRIFATGNFTSFNANQARLVRLSPTGSFELGYGFDGAPTGLALGDGGDLLIVGDFNHITSATATSIPRSHFARFAGTGALTASQVTRWGSFEGTVRTIVPAPGGKWLVGGDFSRVGGRLIRNLARLNADGSNDFTFSAAQSPLDGSVLAIAVQGDGKILVGGGFSHYGTEPAAVGTGRLLRLNADGTRDPAFNLREGFDSTVTTVAIQADGKILVGGDFTRLDGRPVSARLVRLLADGSVDAAFLGGTGLDGTPYAIVVQRDDRIFVGGRFSAYNTASATGLIRLHQNGVLDTTLVLPAGLIGQGTHAIVLQANDQLLIGGNFGFQGEGGLSRWGLGRLNADGSADMTFNTGVGFTSFALEQEDSGGTVTSLALQGDGKIIAVGSFTEFNGVNRGGIARLNVDGTLDTTFADLAGNLYSEHNSVVLRPDGSVLIAGDSLSVNGTKRHGLMAITGGSPAPIINAPLVAQSAIFGGTATFSVVASGTPAPTFQWQRNGVDIPGATAATYTITSASQANAGLYRVIVTNSGGSVPSAAVPFDVVTRNLINFYASASLPAKGSIASSFMVEGTQPKTVLLIGVGGTRATVTIIPGGGGEQIPTDPLPNGPTVLNPRLRLHNSAGTLIAENNDWGSAGNLAAIVTAATQVAATPGLTPTGEGVKDAAILVTLAPGTYTVVLDGADTDGGSGLLQIYDADTDGRPRLVMFTLRANVGSGNKTVVAGFTVDGTLAKTVLLRVLGESLGASTGVLRDPSLTLYRGATLVDSNDDSSISNPVALAAHAQVGVRAFAETFDSTLLKTLDPGAYTAQIAPFGSGSFGTALFELFEVDAQRPVIIAPVITYLSTHQDAVPNGRTAFGVEVVAKPAATYQWRRNGTPLLTNVTSSNAVLELHNVQPADAATYDVVITSGANTLTSPARTLTLLPEFHASDSDRDRRIGLIELTRIIQLYNYRDGTVRTGEYHTLAGTEDGFTLGPGAITNVHAADSNRDGRIDVLELTRVIELYLVLEGTARTGAYHAEAGTEDGFAPGPAANNSNGAAIPPAKPHPNT